ncbi:heparan-alpha-glucosaminide N-acetyltransferase domain-containing protein [Georgenia sp. AZ-5]|uniref:heparan-alpha-glucosaminide N-acetyltransferase domain-containing protein n=1 Tax=Georgenia sp. AZ-5 TaxID=3367526 RepID=UPI0037552F1E
MDIPHACDPATGAVEEPSKDRSTGRLVGIDIARGIALLGMMAIHILDPASPDGNMSLPWVIAAGKSAALFAVVAGVGIAFASGRHRLPRGRRWTAAAVSLVVRALIIGAVGLALGAVVRLPTAAVILPYYAVLFVLAIPLLRLRVGWLALLGALSAVAVPVLSHVWRAGLPPWPKVNPTFDQLLADPAGVATQLLLTGMYPALPWVAYLCVGMAVGRSRLSSRGVVLRITAIGVGLALAASTASWVLLDGLGGRAQLEADALGEMNMSLEDYAELLVWGPSGTLPTSSPWWLAVLAPHATTPVDLVYTIGTSLAVLGGAILLGRMVGGLLTPLAKAGAMTFTLYTAHLLLLVAVSLPEHDAAEYGLQVLAVVAFALLWTRRFSRGPLEQAVWWTTTRVRQRIVGTSAGAGPRPG